MKTRNELQNLLNAINETFNRESETIEFNNITYKLTSLPHGEHKELENLAEKQCGIWSWSNDGYAIIGEGTLSITHFDKLI
jgi:hypothetical protein